VLSLGNEGSIKLYIYKLTKIDSELYCKFANPFVSDITFIGLARNREFDEKAVIEKAVNLFWNKGYNAVSTQDLIDAFGISRSSMYGAYKDKRSLFILALQQYRQTASQAMIAVLGNKNIPFAETMALLLDQIIKETITDNQSKGCFIVNTAIELAPHDKEILALIQENRQHIVEALSTAIQRGIDDNELSKNNNPKALANYFYNLINGLRVDAKVTKDKLNYQETIKIALSVLEREQ
jgi:TetR/AcrR family transcriptional regulator, transcriptional repressor for nem operon